MTCQHCGAGISENSIFCTYCGASVLEAAEHFAGTPPHLAGTPAPLPNAPAYKLDLGRLLGDTFELYTRNFGTMCLVGAVMCGIPFIFYIGSMMSFLAMHIVGREAELAIFSAMLWGIHILMQILYGLAFWYVILGAIRQGLHLARGGTDFRIDMMFPPPMMFLKVVGLTLLLSCISYGAVLLCLLPVAPMLLIAYFAGAFADNGIATGMIAMIAVGILLYIIGLCAATWLWIRLFLAEVFIADQDTGIIESMKYAWRITSSNFWMLFVAGIVLTICSMVGMILFFVGIILTIAICWLGAALAYLQLTGQPNCLDYAMMQQQVDAQNPTEPAA